MRTVMIAGAVVLALGMTAKAQELRATPGSGDYRVLTGVADARAEFGAKDYDQVVEALKPDLQPAVYNTLSSPMRYEVLRLYARALYGLTNWDEAHEAFVDLTRSSHATRADWLLRLDTAAKVGDGDDVTLSRDRLVDLIRDNSDDDDGNRV